MVERVVPNALEPVNRFHLRAAVVGLFGASVMFAQTPRPTEPSLRFTVFSAQPITDVSYLPRTGLPAIKLQFYPTARSPRYEYRGAMPLRFTDGGGAVVAEAVIPPEIRHALLLFFLAGPAAAGEARTPGALKYRIAVLDDGGASHATGGLAVINFSGLALNGTVEGRTVTLKEGLNPAWPIGPAAKIALTTTFKQRIYQSYSTTLSLKKNERALLILFPPFYKGSLEVQSRLLIDEPPAVASSGGPK